MDEQDWIILKVLYEKKNITKTAESLYISQPSLTKKIQQIEKEYQVEIVKRGTKGVHFTPQGEYLAQCADEMLGRLQQIKDTVIDMGEEVSGTLRLGVSNYITRHKLPHLLKLFREQFPKVNYKVTTGWSRDVFNLVYNRDVHIGMVRGDYQWPDSKILLFEENLCVTSLEKIELRDLPQLPRIEYETDALLKTMIDNWWSGEFSQPPFIGMEVDKADTCKEMVLNGLGYGILPSVLIQEHQHLNRIILKNKKGDPIVRKTWMFYHEKSLETKVIKEFVEFVKKLDFKSSI
ncbi:MULTISPECIES: LysR family transcriptional regulator [Neobacillus]|uniref:LysR family transcriptional regulator n=1 Tax=Neobacillus rhizophilus TaxID=2833579 RepID=A0A942U4M5_9BACI|nr:MULTISPECIES: LysR family transcriptional regulator [Neobacillus]MBS4214600.1 LysR family transcriptional regulator [Neobacillus rhizophilus]MBU8918496.1 LysR family transcriptional regulator [Bacillus sp. FJAT-29953]